MFWCGRFFMGLTHYEKAEPAFRDYFPDLIQRNRYEDGTNTGRWRSTFAPARGHLDEGNGLNSETLARKRARVTALPNDPRSDRGSDPRRKKLAEKNPRAAEASFKSVLAKYPNQARAWYGLGMVAVLDHDAERAKEVFGRLTIGSECRVSRIPLVMSWSHIYLGRIFEEEGQWERAKTEYQAVLAVQGAPAQAQQAAQKGLGDLDLRKPSERP